MPFWSTAEILLVNHVNDLERQENNLDNAMSQERPQKRVQIPFRYSQRKRPMLNALTYSLSRCNGVNSTEEQLVTIKSGEWITKSTGFMPLTTTCKKRLEKKKKQDTNDKPKFELSTESMM